MTSVRVRPLGAADVSAFEAFLAPRAESSLFLLANSRRAGFADAGRPFEGTYAGAFEAGLLTAVAAHFWNGIVAVQAPVHLDAVLRRALGASGRAVAGLTGPYDQVVAARSALGASSQPAAVEAPEGLFVLDLADLLVPEALASGAVRCRRPREGEIALLAAWRAAYRREVLGEPPGAANDDAGREDVRALQAAGSQWVLEADGALAAYSAFNARLPEIVQVGGVWTPPERRGKGFARAVVAASLLQARAQGVARAVLFTESPAARRAYEAIGFRKVGEYGLVIFTRPVPSRSPSRRRRSPESRSARTPGPRR
ncbi:MAG: GNAT family N-acetyltransferase [Thermoanaerobaculia bacterium]